MDRSEATTCGPSVCQEQPDKAPVCLVATTEHQPGGLHPSGRLHDRRRPHLEAFGHLAGRKSVAVPQRLLAKMAATVDIIAGGRLDFGIGVGASRVEMENPGIREVRGLRRAEQILEPVLARGSGS
jgi:hypothetical protein